MDILCAATVSPSVRRARALSRHSRMATLSLLSAVLVLVLSVACADAEAPCDAAAHADSILLLCVMTGSGTQTPACCRSVLTTADRAGSTCICRTASTPQMVASRHTSAEIVEWYHNCGGRQNISASLCFDRAGSNGSTTLPREEQPISTHHQQQQQQAQVLPVVVTETQAAHHSWPWYGVLALVVVVCGTIIIVTLIWCCMCAKCARKFGSFLKSVVETLLSFGALSGSFHRRNYEISGAGREQRRAGDFELRRLEAGIHERDPPPLIDMD